MAKRGKLRKDKSKDSELRPFRPRRYAFFMLIVCEDAKTEPHYFRQFKDQFPEETVYLREIGTGRKPKGIVKQALIERDILGTEIKKEVDEVWVVFDKDDEGNNDTTLKNFNDAWALASKEQIQIAFSNEVFEVWLLLHFVELNSEVPIPRSNIYSQLQMAVQQFAGNELFVYVHGETEIIDLLPAIGDEKKAIERASKLASLQRDRHPIHANPSTSVYILVIRLRDLIEWYSYIPE